MIPTVESGRPIINEPIKQINKGDDSRIQEINASIDYSKVGEVLHTLQNKQSWLEVVNSIEEAPINKYEKISLFVNVCLMNPHSKQIEVPKNTSRDEYIAVSTKFLQKHNYDQEFPDFYSRWQENCMKLKA